MPCAICLKDIPENIPGLPVPKNGVCDGCLTDLVSEPKPTNEKEFSQRLQELKFKKRLEE